MIEKVSLENLDSLNHESNNLTLENLSLSYMFVFILNKTTPALGTTI